MIILLIFGAGFFLAFLFMILASFCGSKISAQVLCTLAFVTLVLQGGCWGMAAKVGHATGGSSNGVPEFLLIGSFLIAGVWSYALLAKYPPDPDDKDNNNIT